MAVQIYFEKKYRCFVVMALMAAAPYACFHGDEAAGVKLTVLFSADADAARKALLGLVDLENVPKIGPVEVDDILSLELTITEIALDRAGSGNESDEPVIRVLADAFELLSIGVPVGTTVDFVWESDTLHTITSGSPDEMDAGMLFDESADAIGAVVQLEFIEAGTFPFFSDSAAGIEANMAGVIVVTEDSKGGESEGEGEGEGSK